MADLVIVTSHKRPEFLYLSLEALYAALGHSQDTTTVIRVYEDTKPDDPERFSQENEEIAEVLAYWVRGFSGRLHPILRPVNSYYGNSYSVLEAYKRAYQEDWDRVFLIEDDVSVSLDFFEFHKKFWGSNYFCSIAGQTERNPIPPNQNGFFESDVYASLGVCWPRQNLSWVLDHATSTYYNNPTMHILNHFKDSKLGLTMMEQDGLISRIIEQRFENVAWSSPCRAFHFGAWGYHRGIAAEHMPAGSLSERIEILRKNISSPEWFQKVASFQTDLQVVPSATN